MLILSTLASVTLRHCCTYNDNLEEMRIKKYEGNVFSVNIAVKESTCLIYIEAIRYKHNANQNANMSIHFSISNKLNIFVKIVAKCNWNLPMQDWKETSLTRCNVK